MGEKIDLLEELGPVSAADGPADRDPAAADPAAETSPDDQQKGARQRRARRRTAPKLLPITVRFTAQEKARTEKNAAAAGLSVSRFLAVTGTVELLPLTEEERDLYIKIAVALNRVGSNLNQLAAAMNAARRGLGAAPEQSEIEKAGEAVRELIKDVRERIGL